MAITPIRGLITPFITTYEPPSRADDYKSCITLRTLNYGNSGIFLMMGNAGFISSTVVWFLTACMIRLPKIGLRLVLLLVPRY